MLRFYAIIIIIIIIMTINVLTVPLLLWRLRSCGRGLVWGQLVNRHVRGWMSLADP